MANFLVGCTALLLITASVFGQDAPQRRVVQAGTPLAVRTDAPVPMRIGERIHGRLVYAVWQREAQMLPEGTAVTGSVVGLTPDRTHRLQSRLRGDFTPFRKPVVRFDTLLLPSGISLPLSTSVAEEGAPLVRLTPPPPAKGGFFGQQRRMAEQMVRDRIAVVTGPDKRDRAVQFLYTQLPYHPQRIQPKTAWTVETTAAIEVSQEEYEGPAEDSAAKTGEVAGQDPAPWLIEAFLKEPMSSKAAHKGQEIRAVVAKPVFNEDHSVAVPEGSVLEGAITQVRPARWFGRSGVLRFDFRQLRLPAEGSARPVQTSLAGIDASGGRNLALDSEGQVQPKPKDKVLVPLLLLALASRPLDRDGGDGGFGKDAVASNSLGLVGFLVGTAGGWHNVAAGIGYYGTAVSLWNRWIKRGEETAFVRDTRVIVQTTPRRSTPLPTSTPQPAPTR